jgi:mannose-6-phosphate isomerase
MSSIHLVRGVVKHYDWGGHHFLPAILNSEDTQKPYAEYWMGTHPQGISQLENVDGSIFSLKDKISNLSFLLKVLDVRDMLSIQVHPTKSAAKIEFERENKEGIDLSAPTRNYKDDNHKPELMVALSSFWLLHGFKVERQLKETLKSVSEFSSLLPVWESGGNEALYKYVMNLSQQESDQLLLPLLERLSSQYQKGALPKSSPDFWAARAGEMYCKNGHADRGIFSIYFFNLVHLNPGEAVFQNAGIPHAYLEGQNVEIMANSDNVLRGGLTYKHVDVPELMKHTRCEGIIPQRLLPQKKDEPVQWFETPVTDFRLGVLSLEGGLKKELQKQQPCFLLSLSGTVELISGGTQLTLKQGQIAAFWDGSVPLTISSLSKAVVYVATSGIHTS